MNMKCFLLKKNNNLCIIAMLINLILLCCSSYIHAIESETENLNNKKPDKTEENINLNPLNNIDHVDDEEKGLTTIPIDYLNEDPEEIKELLQDFKDSIPKDKVDRYLLAYLEKILNKDGFDLMNGRLWLLKALLYAPAAFFCGANTLIIAKTGSITARLIIAAQFTVPRTIESVCYSIDKARLGLAENKLANWIKEIPQNKIRTVWSITRLAVGIYLAYAYSLIDAQTAGDAYEWLREYTTNDKTQLQHANNTGFFFNFIYTALLGSVFFYELIDEVVMRTGAGYYLGVSPFPTKDLEHEAHLEDLDNLRAIISAPESNDHEDHSLAVHRYLSDRNINSIDKIASLQKCLAGKYKPNGKAVNTGVNLFKFVFIAGMTVLCGVSFKYIFASNTILRNYLDTVGKSVGTKDNPRYIFQLKNGSNFVCTSLETCTRGVNFNNIVISDYERDHLTDLNKTADLANILQGIAISADTAVLILTTIGIIESTGFFKPIFSCFAGCQEDNGAKIYRNAYKKALFKTSKIIPVIGAALIFPAMICYLDNVNDVRPIAKTANALLEAKGKSTFLPVDLGVITTIGVLGATFFLGARLLSNLPNAVFSAPGKIMRLPADTANYFDKIKGYFSVAK